MRRHFSVCFITILVLLFITVPSLSAKVQVGEVVTQQFETLHPYPVSGTPGVVMEKVFHHPHAGYISLHFARFDLAPGDYVEIANGEETVKHVYRGKGKATKDGDEFLSTFWAAHIPGDTAVVKLYSRNPNPGWGFEIDKWVRGYEREVINSLLNNLDRPDSEEAICTADDKEWAKCYSGTTMYNESRAVCRLLINGNSACTGWLVGSEGHIMTNNHCIDTQTDANNTDYEFMAEGGTCTTDCSGWFDCAGTVAATSGTLVQTSSTLDYTLIKLPGNLSSTYGYMQLRNALPTINERIYIPQHPGGKGKQLAVNSDRDGGYCKVYSTNETPCMGGPGDIGYYGDTEGGSSGSPVLAYADHLVVALHHCANCPNRGVPIPSIISDLGANLPNDAIGGSSDTTPPVITNVASGSVTSSSAVITWDTDEGATSVVHYGTTTSYGSTASATGYVTAHSVNLTGLTPNTLYHYKVVSADSSANSAESADYTFTTPQGSADPDIYVYNIYMQKFSYFWFWYYAQATVTVKDTDGNVVPNATVTISWSGKASGSANGVTNSSGQILFQSGTSFGNGTFTVTVTNVTHATLNYNSSLNNETSDSI